MSLLSRLVWRQRLRCFRWHAGNRCCGSSSLFLLVLNTATIAATGTVDMPIRSSVNVAMHQPCTPNPPCKALVDGNANMSRARRSLHGADENNTGAITTDMWDNWLSPAAIQTQVAFASSSYTATTFKVFLAKDTFVSQVIVFSSPVRGGNFGTGSWPRRKLVVMTLEVGEAPQDSGDALVHRGNHASTGSSDKRFEKEVGVAVPGGILPTEFVVNAMAAVVAVEWGEFLGGPQSKSSSCRTCGGLQITEVAVMSMPPVATAGMLFKGQAEHPDLALNNPGQVRARSALAAELKDSLVIGEAPIGSDTSDVAPPAISTTEEDVVPAVFLPVSTSEKEVSPIAFAHQKSEGWTADATATTWTGRGRALFTTTASGTRRTTMRASAATTLSPQPQESTTTTETRTWPDRSRVHLRLGGSTEVAPGHATAGSYSSAFLSATHSSPMPPGMKFTYATAYVACLALLAAIAATFVPRFWMSIIKFQPGAALGGDFPDDEIEAPPLLDLAEFLACDSSSSTGVPQVEAGEDTAEHYHIGTPRSASGSLRLESEADTEAMPPASETEPEGEPSSSNGVSRQNSPRLPPEATLHGSSVEADLHSPLSTEPGDGTHVPAPVVLGRSDERAAESPMPAAQSPPATSSSNGKVLLLYASPLAYRSPQSGGVHAMMQIPVEREWDVMVQAYNQAVEALREGAASPSRGVRQPSVSLVAQLLTSGSLQRAVAPVDGSSAAAVLHISAHGHNNHIMLEDGRATAHPLSCEMLGEMLKLRSDPSPDNGNKSNLKVIILNACSLQSAGAQFEQGGVPHVICSSIDLRDSASRVFLGTFYSNLFAGSTVSRAFEAARVALRSDPEASTRSASEFFHLLPEGSPHNEVIFPPVQSAATGNRVAGLRAELGDAKSTSSFRAQLVPSNRNEHPEESGSEGLLSSQEVSSGAASVEDISSGSGSDSDINHHRPSPAARGSSLVPSASTRGRQASDRRPTGFSSTSRALRMTRPRGGSGGSSSGQEVATSVLGFGLWGLPRVPQLPEDFLGRTLDVWQVVQHLTGGRRAVVVCGGHGEEHGIGKSAVLDAVHRAFVLNTGGIGVPVHLRSLGDIDAADAASASAWLGKILAAVRLASYECQRIVAGASGVAALRRRTGRSMRAANARGFKSRGGSLMVSRGFHPLSEMGALARGHALQEVIDEMCILAEINDARRRKWPSASGEILLLLYGCDHLVQQQHFQEVLVEMLHSCAAYRTVLGTQHRMDGTGGGKFKVVHHPLEGLKRKDAAQLFLRRAQRPLLWEELLPARGGTSPPNGQELRGVVGMGKDNENQILDLVARNPVVAAQRGNPRRVIELANRLNERPLLGATGEANQAAHRPSSSKCLQ